MWQPHDVYSQVIKELEARRLSDSLPWQLLRALVTFCLYCLVTCGLFIPFICIAALKLLPFQPLRQLCTRLLDAIGDLWVKGMNLCLDLTRTLHWEIEGDDYYGPQDWALVISNHQSWTDIICLLYLLGPRISPFKFFIKQQLLWVPVIGWACWGLDCAFMQRYSKRFLEKNPHLRGRDFVATREACEKFNQRPVTIFNFVEGTRFSAEKQQQQDTPYQHLLKPKAGGLALVLYAMGHKLQHIVDITLVYPQGKPSFWQLLSGRCNHIHAHIQVLPVTHELQGDYFTDDDFNVAFCQWLNQRWQQKDQQISRIKAGYTGAN